MDAKPKGKIGEFFQEYTKYQYFFTQSDMTKGVAVPELQKTIPQEANLITLPDINKIFHRRLKFLLYS